MNSKYLNEILEFEENFKQMKNKRIVLYGIGRYTATLIEGMKGFNFVGLMDKDDCNIGKTMFGKPIIDKATAEKTADLVIINTSETYWEVIYNRISDIKIPIYYKNGQKAKKRENKRQDNPYRDLNIETLTEYIKQAEIVSFDFFDTLFIRLVCNPRDVFQLLEREIAGIWNVDKRYTEVRNEAVGKLGNDYSLDELYIIIEEISGLSHGTIQDIKQAEISLEERLLVPRIEIIQTLKNTNKKEIYIISDMYFPKGFYIDILEKYEIGIKEENILISNELHKSKSNGNLWKYYAEEIVKGKRALHIGDHSEADVTIPKKYGIETYQTPSAWDMLNVSSMDEIVPHICNIYSSTVMGIILRKLFSNPYVLSGTDGVLKITSNQDMGYIVFGPVMLSFFLWLRNQGKESGTKRLVFMSRDGYFLKEDFEYMCSLLKEEPDSSYIGISRQLAMSASITNDEELMEYASMPYSGTIPELFEDRFGINDVAEIPNGTLEQYVEKYKIESYEKLHTVHKNYIKYLEQFKLDKDCAVVDLGYYGNNQRYLNKLLNIEMKGYYFYANLSNDNNNTKIQEMEACFQDGNDCTGEYSNVRKNSIYMESVLTAPYGMVKAVDETGSFICSKKQQNQLHFKDKEEINRGIKEFIHDYTDKYEKYSLEPDTEFIDRYYGLCMGGAFIFADKVKQSFFNDNAMMNRIESMLFY
jgi:HAD superfamily hydrolase (TIGR01549 family)